MKTKKEIRLTRDEFIDFFDRNQDRLMHGPIVKIDDGKITICNFTIETGDHHYFMTKTGDLKTISVSVLTEDHIISSTVQDLWKELTTTRDIKDPEWALKVGYVDQVRFQRSESGCIFYTERVFDENNYDGWDIDNTSEVVLPTLKKIQSDYNNITRGLKELDDSPTYSVKVEILPKSPSYNSIMSFCFIGQPMTDVDEDGRLRVTCEISYDDSEVDLTNYGF